MKSAVEKIIIELEANKEEFEEHEQKFIESVTEFFYKNGYVTEKQADWLDIYMKKLRSLIDPDS